MLFSIRRAAHSQQCISEFVTQPASACTLVRLVINVIVQSVLNAITIHLASIAPSWSEPHLALCTQKIWFIFCTPSVCVRCTLHQHDRAHKYNLIPQIFNRCQCLYRTRERVASALATYSAINKNNNPTAYYLFLLVIWSPRCPVHFPSCNRTTRESEYPYVTMCRFACNPRSESPYESNGKLSVLSYLFAPFRGEPYNMMVLPLTGIVLYPDFHAVTHNFRIFSHEPRWPIYRAHKHIRFLMKMKQLMQSSLSLFFHLGTDETMSLVRFSIT